MRATRMMAAWCVLAVCLVVPQPAHAAGLSDVPPDAKVVVVLNNFCREMGAATKASLPATDEAWSALGRTALKYFHKSSHNDAGDNLKPATLKLSFKKGITNLRLYACPVVVTRVRKTSATSIGTRDSVEMGATYDYFLKRQDGGLTAQIRVFVGEDGHVWLDDVGSL